MQIKQYVIVIIFIIIVALLKFIKFPINTEKKEQLNSENGEQLHFELSTQHDTIKQCTYQQIEYSLQEVYNDKKNFEFVTLIPSSPINNVSFVQLCNNDGQIYFQVAIKKSKREQKKNKCENKIYEKIVSPVESDKIIFDFFYYQKTPDITDYYLDKSTM